MFVIVPPVSAEATKQESRELVVAVSCNSTNISQRNTAVNAVTEPSNNAPQTVTNNIQSVSSLGTRASSMRKNLFSIRYNGNFSRTAVITQPFSLFKTFWKRYEMLSVVCLSTPLVFVSLLSLVKRFFSLEYIQGIDFTPNHGLIFFQFLAFLSDPISKSQAGLIRFASSNFTCQAMLPVAGNFSNNEATPTEDLTPEVSALSPKQTEYLCLQPFILISSDYNYLRINLPTRAELTV